MGDVGSCLLGFAYSVMVVILLNENHSPWVMLACVLVVFNLLFDVVFTVIRRFLRGENVLQAHRSHLFQLMHRLGFEHITVSLCYLCATFVQGMLALWVFRYQTSSVWLIILLLLFIHFLYASLVIRASKRNNLLF